MTVEKSVGEENENYSIGAFVYGLIPNGNVCRHCANPKYVTIGLKIPTLTRRMMYTRKTINGCDLKY